MGRGCRKEQPGGLGMGFRPASTRGTPGVRFNPVHFTNIILPSEAIALQHGGRSVANNVTNDTNPGNDSRQIPGQGMGVGWGGATWG